VVALLHLELGLDKVDEHSGHGPVATLETAHPRLHGALEVNHEGDDDIFLGLEVVVDGALADIGSGGDLVDGDRFDAMLGKQSDGRSYDLRSYGGLLPLPSGLESICDRGHI